MQEYSNRRQSNPARKSDAAFRPPFVGFSAADPRWQATLADPRWVPAFDALQAAIRARPADVDPVQWTTSDSVRLHWGLVQDIAASHGAPITRPSTLAGRIRDLRDAVRLGVAMDGSGAPADLRIRAAATANLTLLHRWVSDCLMEHRDTARRMRMSDRSLADAYICAVDLAHALNLRFPPKLVGRDKGIIEWSLARQWLRHAETWSEPPTIAPLIGTPNTPTSERVSDASGPAAPDPWNETARTGRIEG